MTCPHDVPIVRLCATCDAAFMALQDDAERSAPRLVITPPRFLVPAGWLAVALLAGLVLGTVVGVAAGRGT